LNEDEQIDLVALMWLGRGDGTIDEWEDLRSQAAERRNGYRKGLDKFGISWVDEAPTP
jgi:hypothetical protein